MLAIARRELHQVEKEGERSLREGKKMERETSKREREREREKGGKRKKE